MNDHAGHDMSTASRTGQDQKSQVHGHDGHGGHGWMTIVCCIPMLVITLVLVGTGVIGVGFLVFAVACAAMMALSVTGQMRHREARAWALFGRAPNSRGYGARSIRVRSAAFAAFPSLSPIIVDHDGNARVNREIPTWTKIMTQVTSLGTGQTNLK